MKLVHNPNNGDLEVVQPIFTKKNIRNGLALVGVGFLLFFVLSLYVYLNRDKTTSLVSIVAQFHLEKELAQIKADAYNEGVKSYQDARPGEKCIWGQMVDPIPKK